MEIKPTAHPNNPNLPMLNKLAKLLPLLAIAFAAPVFAASNYSSHTHNTQIAYGEMGNHADQLNLTPSQKTKMEQLRASTRTQIDAILTPEQRQKLGQLQSQRQSERSAGRMGMNLTADQTAKLKAIRTANKEQFKAILTPAQQAQLGQGSRGWGKGGAMARLNLTPEQKAKMEQLRAASRTQMDAILTPEQQQQAKARHDRRQAMRSTWKSLNLTADQQAKIKTIRQSSEEQLNALLTPEQQAQRKAHRHGGRHHRM